MSNRLKRLAAALTMAAAGMLAATDTVVQAGPPPGETRTEFESKLGYQTGAITLTGGMATLNVPPTFRFLGPEGSRRVLVDAWGNPPDSAVDVLGMLVPANVSPLADEGWGIIITYDEEGYVHDNDAGSLDYAKLLQEMQAGVAQENEDRKKAGFEPVTIVGWAEPPHYDAAAHKLYWAKELSFGAAEDHTLNYNIRVLGRRGVLVLNAVSSMKQLATIRAETNAVLSAVDFNDGHRYQDFLPGKDTAAAYGVGGLIAGAAAAKTGLLKLIWIGLLASKKFVFAGLVALIALLRRLFTGRTAPAEPAAASSTEQP